MAQSPDGDFLIWSMRSTDTVRRDLVQIRWVQSPDGDFLILVLGVVHSVNGHSPLTGFVEVTVP